MSNRSQQPSTLFSDAPRIVGSRVETGEVDSETYGRWLRIASEWEALQEELRALSSRWSREKFERGQT